MQNESAMNPDQPLSYRSFTGNDNPAKNAFSLAARAYYQNQRTNIVDQPGANNHSDPNLNLGQFSTQI